MRYEPTMPGAGLKGMLYIGNRPVVQGKTGALKSTSSILTRIFTVKAFEFGFMPEFAKTETCPIWMPCAGSWNRTVWMQQTVFLTFIPDDADLFASLFLLSALFGSSSAAAQSAALVNDRITSTGACRKPGFYPERVFRLNLPKQRLDSIPSEIFSFTNLRELDLSRNRIDSPAC